MTFVDPYFDPELDDLRTLLGVKTKEEFQELEGQITFARQLDIGDAHIPRTNDLVELAAIHRHLFDKIYDWAGQIRAVDIRKNTEGAEFFLPVSRIEFGANYVFGELAEEKELVGLSQDKFVERLAYFYDQLNYIHPFREGNGRTQRIFWSRVAQDAGYEINWAEVKNGENDAASRLAAEKQDLSLLNKMFERIVKKAS